MVEPLKKYIRRRGFTLIELMMVVAIIGLLSAIAIPKFANLIRKAKEASTDGALGAMRSAISIYYADNEGRYPLGLFFLVDKYIQEIPSIWIYEHGTNENPHHFADK